MTTVEEDLLLIEPATTEFDSSAMIDEDLLLGAGDITRKTTKDSVDDFLLDSVDNTSEQDPEHVPDNDDAEQENHDGGDVESDKEELDYDEEEDDDDRRERTSRFTSEKKGGTRLNSEEGDENKKENGADGKTKNNGGGIPSLFDKTITNNPLKSGDQPIGVVLRIEGEAERVFYPPPSFMANQMQQPIVPRLPNGIPLIGMPANHGRAGFGMGYQQQQQQQARMVGGGGMSGMAGGQWDNEVAKFLSGANPIMPRARSGKKRRSSSYSSASSYSSGSRSRSRSSSRDRRRGDDRKRTRRSDDRREVKSYVRRDDRREEKRDDRRRHDDHRRSKDRDSHHSERDSRRRKEQSRNSAIESAKALGLSNDYIHQVNEQKRKREEIVRKKEERRHGPSDKKDINSTLTAPPSTSSSVVSASAGPPGKDKMKAYLAVNVGGVQQLPTAVKKIEKLAVDLGPIKKCWRSAEDVVSIIFNSHDKAKEFMIQYNGKVLSGLRIVVSLDKKFLNLSEVN